MQTTTTKTTNNGLSKTLAQMENWKSGRNSDEHGDIGLLFGGWICLLWRLHADNAINLANHIHCLDSDFSKLSEKCGSGKNEFRDEQTKSYFQFTHTIICVIKFGKQEVW